MTDKIPKDGWTEENLGDEVEVSIEGVKYLDTIIEVYLPDGQRIIGPKLKCGHIFARFSMLPAMFAASEATQEMLRQMEGDE